MPNHIQNRIRLTCEQSRIDELMRTVQNDEEGLGSIDFNKIIPKPKELDIECGSRTEHGFKAYSDFISVYLLGQQDGKVDVFSMHKDKEALELRENVYRLRTKTMGAEHPNTLSAALMLSYSYDHIGQTTAAMELAEDAYHKSVSIYGENSPALLHSISVLVLWYNELEKYGKCLELCEKALRIYAESRGSVKLYQIGEILHSKSIALVYTKEYDEAVECAEENIDIAYKVYGSETSPYYLDEWRYTALIYFKAGKNDKALGIINDAINKQEENNITYPDQYSKKVLKAEILTALGKIDEAIVILDELMEKFGDESDVILCYAKFMKATGDTAEALRCAEKCLELKKGYDRESHEYKEIIRFIDELK